MLDAYKTRENQQKELKPTELCTIEVNITLTTVGKIP